MSLTHPIHVGALVFVSGTDGCLHPTTIARVMPTQIMTDCGRRFRTSINPRSSSWMGREVGAVSNTARLPTPAVVARYQRECAERAASRAKRQGFTEEAES